jgi:hypothetical protein
MCTFNPCVEPQNTPSMAGCDGEFLFINMKLSFSVIMFGLVGFLSSSVFAASICDPAKTYCIITNLTATSITWTVFSANPGWAAFGIGSKMDGASMYIGWTNSTQGSTVVFAKGEGYARPVAQTTVINVVKVTTPIPSWAKLSFAFVRQLSVTPQITPTTAYIFASAKLPPTNKDLISSSYSQHDIFTSVGIQDLTKNGVLTSGSIAKPLAAIPSNMSYEQIVQIHGVLMFLAWAVAPFLAIFIARFLKSIGHLWYQLHVGLFLVCTGCGTIASTAILIVYKTPPHFIGTHRILGLLMLILMVFQIALGFVINALWTPTRKTTPIYGISY